MDTSKADFTGDLTNWTVTTTQPCCKRCDRLPWYQRGAAMFAMYNYVLATGLTVAALVGTAPKIAWVAIVPCAVLAFVGFAWDSR